MEIRFGDNSRLIKETIDENKTIREFLDERGITPYLTSDTNLMLDGAALLQKDMCKKFSDFCVGNKCFLVFVSKCGGNFLSFKDYPTLRLRIAEP